MIRAAIEKTVGHRRLIGILFGFWVGGMRFLLAQDVCPPSSSEPPALTHYKGREIATTMHYSGASWLTRESRQREEDCESMLRELGVQLGMTVCDMGCGNGFYTLEIAKLVGPQGRVLAVDIQPEMLRLMEARAAEAEIRNIESVLGTVADPKLPKGQVDVVLCVDVYHEFSHPESMLRAMRDSLSKHGRIVLVEFRAEDPAVPIKPLHKISKEQILTELIPNGLRLVKQFDGLPWQHMMFFESDPAAADTHPNAREPAPR
jgi:ubiquinone/menaquinone biosynthesis C-methylase UbiE